MFPGFDPRDGSPGFPGQLLYGQVGDAGDRMFGTIP